MQDLGKVFTVMIIALTVRDVVTFGAGLLAARVIANGGSPWAAGAVFVLAVLASGAVLVMGIGRILRDDALPHTDNDPIFATVQRKDTSIMTELQGPAGLTINPGNMPDGSPGPEPSFWRVLDDAPIKPKAFSFTSDEAREWFTRMDRFPPGTILLYKSTHTDWYNGQTAVEAIDAENRFLPQKLGGDADLKSVFDRAHSLGMRLVWQWHDRYVPSGADFGTGRSDARAFGRFHADLAALVADLGGEIGVLGFPTGSLGRDGYLAGLVDSGILPVIESGNAWLVGYYFGYLKMTAAMAGNQFINGSEAAKLAAIYTTPDKDITAAKIINGQQAAWLAFEHLTHPEMSNLPMIAHITPAGFVSDDRAPGGGKIVGPKAAHFYLDKNRAIIEAAGGQVADTVAEYLQWELDTFVRIADGAPAPILPIVHSFGQGARGTETVYDVQDGKVWSGWVGHVLEYRQPVPLPPPPADDTPPSDGPGPEPTPPPDTDVPEEIDSVVELIEAVGESAQRILDETKLIQQLLDDRG